MKYTFLFASIMTFFSLSAQMDNGLVANLKFEGNAQDASTSQLNTQANNLTYGTDYRGNLNAAGVFGSSSNISIPDSSNIKVKLPLTVSTWIKVNSFALPNVVFKSDDVYNNYHGYWSNIGTDGKIAISFGAGLGGSNSANRRSFVADTPLQAGKWHHVVMIIKAYNDMKIYIDCVESTGSYSGSGSTTMAYSDSESVIGDDLGNPAWPNGTFLDGSIDDFMVWDRALSDFEIQYMCMQGTCTSTVNDTIINYVADTSIVTVYDTTKFTVYDTTTITVTDTLKIYVSDLLSTVFDADDAAVIITMYPNPAQKNLTIENNQPSVLSGGSFVIYNSLGAIMYSESISGSINSVDASTWTNGVYFLHVMIGGTSIDTRKIVIKD